MLATFKIKSGQLYIGEVNFCYIRRATSHRKTLFLESRFKALCGTASLTQASIARQQGLLEPRFSIVPYPITFIEEADPLKQ
jgi:hypothetical protein